MDSLYYLFKRVNFKLLSWVTFKLSYTILIKDKLPIDKLPDNLESKLNKLDLIVLREIRTDLLKDIINIESLEDLEEYLN